ncbi:MAG TPA: 30S ribosomal protein S6 [Halanaerobiales bacterium]|nr:30S ribosomal protein S6 [Halanaerobiales bacterium]
MMVRAYETVFILEPEMEEEDREALIDRIKSIITDNKGEITQVDTWGRKKLAYEINNFKNGYYTVINFNGESETVDELERNYKIIDSVIRYLIINKEK